METEGKDDFGQFSPGNKFYQLRSKFGRDKIIEDAEILHEKITEYFIEVEGRKIDKPDLIKTGDLAGQQVNIKIDDFPTKEELATFLGFAKWESLKNYKEYTPAFLEVITWAETQIHNWKFKMTSVGVLNANIISRDLGLIDRKDVEINDKRNIDTSKLSDSALEELENALKADEE